MNCTACASVNRPGRRYCGQCGHDVASPCPQCGFLNEERDRFCGGCRGALGARAGHPSPEPRGATASTIDELEGLFVAPPVAITDNRLPATGIAQDDLDRLFGVAP